jgi:hypothetical protein
MPNQFAARSRCQHRIVGAFIKQFTAATRIVYAGYRI